MKLHSAPMLFGAALMLTIGGACSDDTDSSGDPGRGTPQPSPTQGAASPTPQGSAQPTPQMSAEPSPQMSPSAQPTAMASPTPMVTAPPSPGPSATPSSVGEICFSDIFDPATPGPNYDQYGPTLGSHCHGTNHQDIEDFDRVVFLGDSVTVGSPPTMSRDFYRSRLADMLADEYPLAPAGATWKLYDPFDGMGVRQADGDFWNCSKWGARTDDLMPEGRGQVLNCFPAEEVNKRTLVIMTIGANDIANITKKGPEGVPLEMIWDQTRRFVQDLEDAVAWMKDPANVPGGVDIVFGNMFEFTDATGDVSACRLAGVGGFDEPWEDVGDLEELVIWANEQYMRIAVDYGADMVFMLENFCGHGFRREDPESRCYRGPDTELWFDFTCIHPNPRGHEVIAEMFMSVIRE